MKIILVWILWCVLFVLCWPVALAALALIPIIWLISLPLRLIVLVVEMSFSLVKTVLFLPAKILGWRERDVA